MESGVINELPKPIRNNLGGIPFDQFSRQYIAWRTVERIRANTVSPRRKTPLKILDIGGHGGKSREFFPEDDVTVLDVYDIEETGYVQGDALDLPFGDNEFDITLSFDVLEHIPAGKRRRFVEESARTAETAMVVAAPFYSKMARQTEFALNHYHKTLTGRPHQWLQEHIDYGLPKAEDLEKHLSRANMHFSAIPSNELNNWAWTQFTVLLTAASDVSSQYLEQLYSFYNTHLSSLGDYSDNSYRRVYIASPHRLPPDIDKGFENAYSWEDQLTLKEITFQHIAQMKQNARDVMIHPELNWYKTMITRLERENAHIHYLLALRQNELEMINQSRGWRIIRLTRRLRSKLQRVFTRKQEEQ